jgi:putative DNA primase/helicase
MTETPELTQFEYVEELTKKGYYLYPTYKNSKGQSPKIGNIQTNMYNATNDIKTLKKWLQPNKNGELKYNVSINLQKSNMVMLDIDRKGEKHALDGMTTFEKWASEHPELLKDAVTEYTSGSGIHLYYKNNLELDKSHYNLVDGIELRTDQSRIFPTDGYTQTGKTLADTELKPIPAWLADKIKDVASGKNKQRKMISGVADNHESSAFNQLMNDLLHKDILKGDRHTEGIKVAGRLVTTPLAEKTQRELFSRYNQEHIQPHLSNKDLNSMFNSAWKNRDNVNRMNIENISKTNAGEKAWNWCIANGSKDEKGGVRPKKLPYYIACGILLDSYHFARFSNNEHDRIAIYVDDKTNPAYGTYTQNYRYLEQVIMDMYKLYKSKDLLEVIKQLELSVREISEQENSRELIPVGNGIYDLSTKKLLPYSHEYHFTSKVKTSYNAKWLNNKPSWDIEGWFNEIAKDSNGNTDMQVVKVLWQVIADAINGNTTRNKAIFLYSAQGSTGKGTFQALIKSLVGIENVATLKLQDFAQRFATAQLLGKSVCIGDDNPGGYLRDVSTFNSVVTGDPIAIEYKGKDAFTVETSPLVIQSFNELPRVGNKNGTERRMLVVPFNHVFKANTEDDNKLIKQQYIKQNDVLEYVLCKALTFYSDFDNYDVPDVSKTIMNEFKQENDPVETFVQEVFLKWNVPAIPTALLFELYKNYCKNNLYKPCSGIVFSRKAKDKLLGSYSKRIARLTHQQRNYLCDLRENNKKLFGINDISKSNSPKTCFIKK